MGKKRRIKELERRLQGLESDMALLKSLGVELPTTIDVEHEAIKAAMRAADKVNTMTAEVVYKKDGAL